MAEESSNANRVSYAFDDEAKHLVVASCFEGFGKLLVFDVKPNPFPEKPRIQFPLEDACDDTLMLSICSQSFRLRIYIRNSKNRFIKEYSANKTHILKI